MKSTICITLLFIVLLSQSAQSAQCKCNERCKKCCKNSKFTLVPLYELLLGKRTYFYTVSLTEVEDYVQNRGYTQTSVFGLVAATKTDCKKEKSLVAINRFVNDETKDCLLQTSTDLDEKTKKYRDEGIAFYGSSIRGRCGASRPLYRFWTGKYHIYSTDEDEGRQKAGKNAVNEGIICYIWVSTNTKPTTTEPTTTTPPITTTRDPIDNPGFCSMNLTKIFRLYRSSSDSFLFSTDYEEVKNAYKNLNYNGQTSPGYAAPVLPSCRCNLKPAYRLDRVAPKEDNYFTTDKSEVDNAVANLGYTSLGIAFYCAETKSDCGATVPFYKYVRNNAKRNHFHTTDTTEQEAVSSTSQGRMCYIWPEQN